MLKSQFRRLHGPVGQTLGRQTQERKALEFAVEDLAQVLDNDPSLEAFYDAETVAKVNKYRAGRTTTAPVADDEYNFSLIEGMDKFEDVSFSPQSTPASEGTPQTMKTEDFLKLLNKDGEMRGFTGKPEAERTAAFPRKMSAPAVDPYSTLKSFLTSMDSPQGPLRIKNLGELVGSQLPLIVVSKLRDPWLNLAIERYIYDAYPDVKNPLNSFAKRLMVYRNSPCIVVGKNQNVFREVNFRYASILGVPILRRYSGGGTVVHDLGNVNFSFMCPKEEFERTGFTGHLIEKWNASDAEVKLNINEKGDMVNHSNANKVSGSAFQISKGKSLHHGTMLLNSDLQELGKLLKINKRRLEGITDKSTNSIPSPIQNTNVDYSQFVSIICDAFTSGYGLPGKMKADADNVFVNQRGNSRCHVVLLDDLMTLPEEVYKIEKELKSWQWTFGHTPRFEQSMKGLDNGALDVKFTVYKGLVVELVLERADGAKETRMAPLEAALKAGKEVMYTSGDLFPLVEDGALARELCWYVDEFLVTQT